jgi:hypothetical protein
MATFFKGLPNAKDPHGFIQTERQGHIINSSLESILIPRIFKIESAYSGAKMSESEMEDEWIRFVEGLRKALFTVNPMMSKNLMMEMASQLIESFDEIVLSCSLPE